MNDFQSPYAPPTEQNGPAIDVELDAARRAFKGPMSAGYKLVLLSSGVFVLSLALPAMKVHIFSTSEVSGLGCLVWAFLFAVEKPLSIMPFVALSNVWFVFVPLFARSRNDRTLTKAACVSWIAAGVALSLAVFPLESGKTDDLLAGYGVWVLALVLGALGTTVAAIEAYHKRLRGEPA